MKKNMWAVLALVFCIALVVLYVVSGVDNKFELNLWILEQILDQIL